MATTNRKRRKTKHRGNAAGMVEARGKTSASSRQATPGKGGRRNRFDEPPTWRGAAVRAGVAALLFVLLVIFVFGQTPASTVVLGIAVFLMYVPLGYYTDLMLFRRRQKKLGRS
jgi:hypothetical protein